jgi:hypothetical protein
MTFRRLLFGVILAGIAVLPVQAQSADVLPTETAITVNDTNYACIPESVHRQQALPPGVVGSEDPFQNPPSYEKHPWSATPRVQRHAHVDSGRRHFRHGRLATVAVQATESVNA